MTLKSQSIGTPYTWKLGDSSRGVFLPQMNEFEKEKTGPRQAIETCGMIEFTISFYLLDKFPVTPCMLIVVKILC